MARVKKIMKIDEELSGQVIYLFSQKSICKETSSMSVWRHKFRNFILPISDDFSRCPSVVVSSGRIVCWRTDTEVLGSHGRNAEEDVAEGVICLVGDLHLALHVMCYNFQVLQSLPWWDVTRITCSLMNFFQNDISAAVSRNEHFDFLIDIVPREEQKRYVVSVICLWLRFSSFVYCSL